MKESEQTKQGNEAIHKFARLVGIEKPKEEPEEKDESKDDEPEDKD